jgi:hypothetical protein
MRKFLLMGCLILASIGSYAQSGQEDKGPRWQFGPVTGVTWGKSSVNTSNRVFWKQPYQAGWSAGVRADYEWLERVHIVAQPEVIQKNTRLERTEQFEGGYYQLNKTYLQVPLQIQLRSNIDSRFQYSIGAGASVAYWLAGHWDVAEDQPFLNVHYDAKALKQALESQSPYLAMQQYSGKYEFDNSFARDGRKDRRLDLGYLASAGVSYSFPGKLSSIGLEASYQHSLTTLDRFQKGRKPLDYEEPKNKIVVLSLYTLFKF